MGLDIKSYAIGVANGGSASLTDLNATENGSYTHLGYDGYDNVVVNVQPELEDISITENGTYSSATKYGYDEVVVNVPNPSTGKVNITNTSEVDVTDYAAAQVVDANLVAGNIKKNTQILGITGTYETELEPDVDGYTYPDLNELKDSLSNSADEIFIVVDKRNIPTATTWTFCNWYYSASRPMEIGHISNGSWVVDTTVTSSNITLSTVNDVFIVRVPFYRDALSFETKNDAIGVLLNVNTIYLSQFNCYGCKNLRQFICVKSKLSSSHSGGNFFSGCRSLIDLDFSGFDISRVSNIQSMFSGCSSINKLNLSGFVSSNITNINNMFSNCYNLEKLDVSDWDTSNIISMNNPFTNIYSLKELDLSDWNTSNVTTMSNILNWSYIKIFKAPNRIIADDVYNGLPYYRTGVVSYFTALDSTETTKTLIPPDSVKSKLTPEDIAIATAKGYTVSIN